MSPNSDETLIVYITRSSDTLSTQVETPRLHQEALYEYQLVTE